MSADSKTLQRRAKITGRQMDYWFRQGWLISFGRRSDDGSGIPLIWPDRTVYKAIIMGRLIRAGFVPQRAHELAEQVLNTVTSSVTMSIKLDDGIHLAINLREKA